MRHFGKRSMLRRMGTPFRRSVYHTEDLKEGGGNPSPVTLYSVHTIEIIISICVMPGSRRGRRSC